MTQVKAWAAPAAGAPLVPHAVERREVGERDILIDIAYCGVCHSDIHQARDEWGGATFPMVPGHEIVGRVARVGAKVTRFRPGDHAGVGCLVDSCRTCEPCRRDLEQFCERGPAWTYNSTEMDRRTPTHGGYSKQVVVTEDFALKVSPSLDLAAAAPLLCAGITTYSPLHHWKVGPGQKVGVVGLGGLGHMAVKLAAAMGAEVTMLSTSPRKEADARRLGASGFALTSDDATFRRLRNHFDFVLDTISAPHDYDKYLGMVKVDGAMVLVGVPPERTPLHAHSLIGGRRTLAGSLIGGIAETQEMLDFCAEKQVVSDVEVIPIEKINEAYERMIRGDVRYRFVIDLASL
ncbi:NAD(P)-dependent alcohol dehydrogenase [Anaeromyxobacter dehalogenans]|uniref:Zinc-binding alcohol dehydrogenase n=1 Tax=Anaeromyxobacter dehalogenans (strain 2CP-C) TaxID=290397 RepID=Q2IQ55_ANADE|nr:NAD(P)-dependent alcohol dehydrogenase [Anaeromyxobacter dehalogenans]ABC80936.1 zinc-binding alcohol dehydrogenase [Anaeromyxobacter dehalogenans 2CP-C]